MLVIRLMSFYSNRLGHTVGELRIWEVEHLGLEFSGFEMHILAFFLYFFDDFYLIFSAIWAKLEN